MITYDIIKALAKESSQGVESLIALARQNDPFYAGTPADKVQAAWFASLWRQFDYHQGVHIRRAHYQIISQDPPVLLPTGVPYENTDSCWKYLNQAAKMARYLNLVDPGAFVDRRNPDPALFLQQTDATPTIQVVNDAAYDKPTLPALPALPGYYIGGVARDQRYHLEVWCEKSTMNDILLPLCRQYEANLQTGLGEMSITTTLAAVNRIIESGRPARIFYVSDFDPAGQSMPVATARKIEYFVRALESECDIRLFPVVLTAEQCRTYRLPRTPIKDTEKRAARFEDRHGDGATELDALEALHPGVLRRILTAELDRYYDHDLVSRVWRVEDTIRGDADDVRDRVISLYHDDIQRIKADYTALCSEFEERLASQSAQMQRIWGDIEEQLTGVCPDIHRYDIPEPDQAAERPGALYASDRGYMEQIEQYKLFQGK